MCRPSRRVAVPNCHSTTRFNGIYVTWQYRVYHSVGLEALCVVRWRLYQGVVKQVCKRYHLVPLTCISKCDVECALMFRSHRFVVARNCKVVRRYMNFIKTPVCCYTSPKMIDSPCLSMWNFGNGLWFVCVGMVSRIRSQLCIQA